MSGVIVRNSGDSILVQYAGGEFVLPGHGDTTMLSPDAAVHVCRLFAHVGVQAVDAEAEAAERAKVVEPVVEVPSVPEPEPPVEEKAPRSPRKSAKRTR